MEKNDHFHYTYSAPKQEEIQKIRQKYLPKSEEAEKMERLRRLDRRTETPGVVLSLILGIAGTLIFGTGMCCVLVFDKMLLGIAAGIAGAVILGLAYPVHKWITEKRRAALAPQILQLTEELKK